MKLIWKRAMSLALSGVLLLGSLPMGALATEDPAVPAETQAAVPAETQAAVAPVAETEPVVTEPAPTETEPAPAETTPPETQPAQPEATEPTQTVVATVEPVSNPVANGEGGETDSYPITVDGVAVNASNDKVTLGEGSSLTLNADVTSIESNVELTIIIPQDKTVAISGILSAKGILKITGDGILKVGQIETADNLEIENTIVKVGTDKTEKENTKNLISVKNEIKISGKAHLATATGHNAVVITDTNLNPAVCKITGAGYYRSSADGSFSEVTDKKDISLMPAKYLEFVSKEHLSETFNGKDQDKHHKTCADEDCPLRSGVKIGEEDHDTTAVATCCKKAMCGVCGEYGEYDYSNHESGETKYIAQGEQSTHLQVHSCCERACDNAQEDPHDYQKSLSDNKEELITKCKVCPSVLETVKIMAPAEESLVWDGQPKAATTTPENAGTIVYYKDAVPEDGTGGTTDAPTEPGKYIAVLSVDGTDLKPQVEFTIHKAQLTSDMITIEHADNLTYHGPSEESLTERNITVSGLTKGTDFTVEYYRGNEKTEDYNSAGTITVKVTMLDASSHYTGSAEKTYEIQKADVPDNAFEPNILAEDIVYDGTVKTLQAKKKNEYANNPYGDATVVFYQNSQPVEQPKNAGTYELKIDVAENQNYKEATIERTPAWTVEIKPTNAYDIDSAMKSQVVCDGVSAFTTPDVWGVEVAGTKEKVEGTFVYTYNQVEYHSNNPTEMAALNTELKKLDNQEGTVSYTFTPSNANYAGTKTGTIKVKGVKLTFTVGEAPVSNQNPALTVKDSPKYLDTDIVTLKTITASDGENSTTSGFSVLFQKAGAEEKAVPDAGENSFKVYFSGQLGGITYDKIVVDTGWVTIGKKTPDITVTAVANLTDRDAGEPLVTVTSNGEKIKYSIDGGTSWSYDIPAVPAEQGSGVYKIKYEVEETTNFAAKAGYEDVEVVVVPYLTATYKTTLESVEGTIHSSKGTWRFNTEANPLTNTVGPVNEEGNTVYMNFTPTGSTTATKHPVKIYVQPAHISLNVAVADKFLPYNKGNAVNADVIVTVKQTETTGTTSAPETFPSSEYTVVRSNITNTADGATVKNPGRAQVKVVSAGNYIFDNTEEELTKEYIVYRAGSTTLGDTAEAVPPAMPDDYETGKDIKEALDEKYSDTYLKTKRTYKKYMMLDKDMNQLYDEFYWPDDGFASEWKFEKGLTKDDNFKIWGIYTVTSDRLGTTAGELFEMEQITSGTPGVNQFRVDSEEIKFNLKNYAVLCFAAEVDLTKEYDIAKSIVLDNASSTKGKLTIKVNDKEVTKATYGDEVKVTATANSGYSIEKVTFTAASGETVNSEKISEGNYKFTMPASKVTVKLSLKKTTSSSKNPSSGDTSNIHLWLAILAASVVGLLALVLIWFKKRR